MKHSFERVESMKIPGDNRRSFRDELRALPITEGDEGPCLRTTSKGMASTLTSLKKQENLHFITRQINGFLHIWRIK